MAVATNIKYLTHAEIDKAKWDTCLYEASNGLIYGTSIYLDQMSGDWDALIWNDYEAVMPLPWRKKYGIYYLYQPFLCAQLGIFGKQLSADLVNDFLRAIPARYSYYDIYLNSSNAFPEVELPLYSRKNYAFTLHKTYEELYGLYRENTKRNIKKSLSSRAKLRFDVTIDRVISLAKIQSETAGSYTDSDYENFKTLFLNLQQKQMAEIYAIISSENNILASAVFLTYKNRAYYILVGNTAEGKESGAPFALVDAFIKNNAGKELILDFEGSDNPGVAFFYSGFGAAEELYPCLRMNRLPWYIRWLKK